MDPHLTTFVVPTYRLRDVGETVERYDDNFWRNGHSTRLVVFDDSSQATHEKYFPLLERTKTHNELYYVGPKEKAAFVHMLVQRLGGAEARIGGEEPVPPELRREPELHADVYAGRLHGQRGR